MTSGNDAHPSAELCPRVLVVDDEKQVRNLLRSCLRRLGCLVAEASCGTNAISRLEADSFDAMLVDLRMPGVDGIETSRRAKRLCPGLYTVLMTGYATIEIAVRALKEGANDFLPKPFRIDQLRVILEKVLERRATGERGRLMGDFANGKGPLPGLLVGASRAIEDVYRAIRRVAHSSETVLIEGESGTGKELAAQAIHFWSSRHSRRFVSVNCPVLTETIIESELFGHEPGSFTGAHKRTKGLVEQANGGTLLLDEIGDATPACQTALLRVLQEGEIRRVGSAEATPVNIRVVAATHRDLEDEVRRGRFRTDLYYRLNVVPIHVPPLRDRPEDIPLLIEHFLERRGAAGRSFSDDAIGILQRCPWPGNVRELDNLVGRVLVLNLASIIRPQHLPPQYREKPERPALTTGSLREAREAFERDYMKDLLERVGGNVAEAARQAGIGRPYLHQKLRKFGINPEVFRDHRPDANLA